MWPSLPDGPEVCPRSMFSLTFQSRASFEILRSVLSSCCCSFWIRLQGGLLGPLRPDCCSPFHNEGPRFCRSEQLCRQPATACINKIATGNRGGMISAGCMVQWKTHSNFGKRVFGGFMQLAIMLQSCDSSSKICRCLMLPVCDAATFVASRSYVLLLSGS